MQLLRTRSFGAFGAGLLVLAGVGLSAANAQELRGSFNLPFQAHWGKAVLEPGEYTFSLPTARDLFPLVHVSREGKTVMVLINTSRTVPQSERSYLRIENAGKLHVIKELSVGSEGKALLFPVPKSIRERIALSDAHDAVVTVAPGVGK